MRDAASLLHGVAAVVKSSTPLPVTSATSALLMADPYDFFVHPHTSPPWRCLDSESLRELAGAFKVKRRIHRRSIPHFKPQHHNRN